MLVITKKKRETINKLGNREIQLMCALRKVIAFKKMNRLQTKMKVGSQIRKKNFIIFLFIIFFYIIFLVNK